ncbi:unnamed protein product [Camellia sinensis]
MRALHKLPLLAASNGMRTRARKCLRDSLERVRVRERERENGEERKTEKKRKVAEEEEGQAESGFNGVRHQQVPNNPTPSPPPWVAIFASALFPCTLKIPNTMWKDDPCSGCYHGQHHFQTSFSNSGLKYSSFLLKVPYSTCEDGKRLPEILALMDG